MAAKMAKFRSFIVAALILIPCVAWLFGRLGDISAGGKLPFFDPDVLLYLRWLEQSILAGKIISFDSYSCFPAGYEIRLPPLLMTLMTQSVFLVHAVLPEGYAPSPEWIVGILPPACYAIIILLTVGIVWRKTGSCVLALSVALASFPGTAVTRCFDAFRLDHHFLETFFLWLWIYACWLYVDTGNEKFIIAGGIAGTALLLSSLGAPLYFFIFCLISGSVWAVGSKHSARMMEFGKSAMLMAGGLCLVYLSMHRPTGNWKNFNEFQWLQPMLVVAGGIFHMVVQYAFSAASVKKRITLSCVGFCIVLSAIAVSSTHVPFMRDAVSLLLNKNRLMGTINELQPLASVSGPDAQFQLQNAMQTWFGCIVIFLPLAFRNSFGVWSGGGRQALIWIISILLLGAAQRRWLRLLGPGQALLFGIILAEIIRLMHFGDCREKRKADPYYFTAMVVLIIFQLGLVWKGVSAWDFPSKNFIEAAAWLNRNSPETSGYSDDKPPEYGILAMWDMGNLVAYYARRPVVANNMQLGMSRLAQVYAAETEGEAYDACVKNKIRYLFMTRVSAQEYTLDILHEIKTNSKNAGNSEYIDLNWLHETKQKRQCEYGKTFYSWAYDLMTFFSNESFAGGATRFRLVYASKNDWGNPVPEILIFKVVEGALIKGKADPGTPVTVTLDCKIDAAPIKYCLKTVAASDGAYAFRVVYPTGFKGGRIKTGDRYSVTKTVGGKSIVRSMEIGELDLEKGHAKVLNDG